VKTATEVIPGACGLAGFAVALLSGLTSQREATSVLLSALVALVLCRMLGMGVAAVCGRLVQDAVHRHKELNPVPNVRAAMQSAAEPAGEATP
jgi:hypothetical protein